MPLLVGDHPEPRGTTHRTGGRSAQESGREWQINVIDDYNGWIAGRYSISSIPHLFIIGRDGKILANHLGYGDRTIDELVSDINRAFADPPSVEQGTPIS